MLPWFFILFCFHVVIHPILMDGMVNQKVVQDAGTNNHLEHYSQVTLAAYNLTLSLKTLKTSLEYPDAMFTINSHFNQLCVEVLLRSSLTLFESRNHSWRFWECRITKQILLVAEILCFWQVNITDCPNPVAMYSTRPSHLNQSNLCSIISNKQNFNCIVFFSHEISLQILSGCEGQRKQSTIN